MLLRKRTARPLHRAILPDALHQAWRERRLWPLALLAGVLQTGGVFDLFLPWFQRLGEPTSAALPASLAFLNRLIIAVRLPANLTLAQFLGWLDRIQGLLIVFVLAIAVFIFSVLCQGALLTILTAKSRTARLKLRAAFARAWQHLQPLAVLNILAFLAIAFITTLALILLASIPTDATWYSTVAVIGSLPLFGCALIITCLHMFSALAVVHENEHVQGALQRAFDLLRGAWLVSLETSALLFLLNLVLSQLINGLATLAAIPLAFLALAAMILKLDALITMLAASNVALFIFVGLIGGAFFITFQYAAWNALYRRINERTAVARVTRWLTWLTAK